MYYKASMGGVIVDAYDSLPRVYYSARSRMILRCGNKDTEQGVVSTDGAHIWHVDGWPEFPVIEEIDGEVVLSEISYEEYIAIRTAMDEGQSIPDEEEDPELDDEDEPEDEDALAFVKRQRIAYSKKLLAQFLAEHPLVSTAHGGVEGTYAVTEEKQQLMALNYTTYQIQKASGIDTVLTWNETGMACEEWSEADFVQLILEVQAYVKPLVSAQQYIEMLIQGAKTTAEVMAIEIAY